MSENKELDKSNNEDNDNFNILNQFINDSNEIKKDSESKPKTVLEKLRHDMNLSNKKNNKSKEENEQLIKKRLEEEKEKNVIRDKLKCFICFGKVKNAMMCPYCKKLACEQCIKTVLQKSTICSNCKSILLINDMVKLPFLDEFTSFFINNMEQSVESNEVEENIVIELKKEKCKVHQNKNLEYLCINCNEYLCSEDLVFFNRASINKHLKHIILSLDDIEKYNLYKIIKEYRNLDKTKNNLKNKLDEYNKKIVETAHNIDAINFIFKTLENDIDSKYNIKIGQLKSLVKSLNDKKRILINTIQNPPDLIGKLNNKEESKKILVKLKALNNLEFKDKDIIKETNDKKAIKCEQFESDLIEIKLPNNGSYVEEYKIINTELNFIPDIKCTLNCQLLMNNFIFSLIMKVNKEFVIEHSTKILGYFYIESKNMQDVLSPEGGSTNDELIFSAQCEFNLIKDMIDKDGQCFCRILITKFYYK